MSVADFSPELFGAGIFLIILVIILIVVAITIIPYWKIYQRTGQSGAMSLLQLIPLVNIIMLYILAFGDWPIERELGEVKQKLRKQSMDDGMVH